MHYEELIAKYAPKWPYSIRYNQEREIDCDVLVLGGGIAGCWAALGAARKGARVVMVDKGATKTSGAGGAGVDHWQSAVTNPACKISPEEFAQALIDNYHGYRSGITTYIKSRESYDCLLEMEKMGVKIRDSEDEFKGAEFRDEKTKLLFAYDYTAKYTVRVWGTNVKPSLYKECQRLGVNIFERVMVTSLLTQGGKQGARVIGATGVNVHTGEFFIFSGTTTILCMSYPRRNWVFSTELKGLYSFGPPNAGGDGHAIAWQAGAEFAAMEASWLGPGGSSPYGYPAYGVGNAGNTWYACNMVDANGKEIPWIDRDGRILKTVSERYRPAPGQKFFISGGWGGVGAPPIYEYMPPRLIIEGVAGKQNDFAQPFYADLPSMPEMERKVIWGMMLAQESKTLIPIYRTYTQAGFNPDKDLLQGYQGGVSGMRIPLARVLAGGGLVVDWNLKTNLEGLYAAGMQVFSSGCHANAAVTGRYAGRHAADEALGAKEPVIDRKQVEAEKSRIYSPLMRDNGMEWKELNAGVCKVMQDYCGDVKSEELLKLGLKWFDEIEAGEARTARARNPHELSRLLEVFNLMTTSRTIIEACRARKASSAILPLQRADYPDIDPPAWQKWITVRQDEGITKVGTLPLDYHGDMVKNYESFCGQ